MLSSLAYIQFYYKQTSTYQSLIHNMNNQLTTYDITKIVQCASI